MSLRYRLRSLERCRHRLHTYCRTFSSITKRMRLLVSYSSIRSVHKLSMAYHSDRQVWHPSLGIRFSPRAKATQSLYPQLDVVRFVQTTSNSGSEHHAELELVKPPTTTQADEASVGQMIDETFTVQLPLREDSATKVSADNSSPQKSLEVSEEESNKRVVPPSTSLDYQISSERFYDARKSPQGSPASYWSYDMYRKVEDQGNTTNVKVHYCRSKHTMEGVCKQYFQGHSVLGFDLEWQPMASSKDGPRQNVSLIQVASESHVGLFHVALFPKDDFVGPTFRCIMEDANVSKVGVSIKADCTRLQKYLDVSARGLLELSHLYKVVKYSQEKRPSLVNKRLVSLATQVEEYLNLPLYKGGSVRSSDWSRALSQKQIAYSASDAYAGLQLYHVLEEHRKGLDPCPPRPHHSELDMPLEVAMSLEDEVIDDDELLSLQDSLGDADMLIQNSKSGKSAPAPATPKAKPSSIRQSPSSRASSPSTHRDSRVIAAENKLQSYRLSKSTVVAARPCSLRAYYIWYCNDDLRPEAIAKILRDPPLQTHTVTSYILDAVASEKLPYSKQRMEDELLSLIQPGSLISKKYQTLVEECRSTTES